MKIVCLGDSLTYGFPVSAEDGWIPQVAREIDGEMVNCGVCGDTTAGMYRRFESEVRTEEPDKIIIMGGSNDILLDVPLDEVEDNLFAIVDAAVAAAIPVIIGIPPYTKMASSNYGWQAADMVEYHNTLMADYRAYLLKACEVRHLPVIDFYVAFAMAEQHGSNDLYADGVHPNKKGYALFAEVAANVLKNID